MEEDTEIACVSQTLAMFKYPVLPRMTLQYSEFWYSVVSLCGSLLRSPWVTHYPPYTCQFTIVHCHVFCCKSCHSNHISWSSCLARRAIGANKLSKIMWLIKGSWLNQDYVYEASFVRQRCTFSSYHDP